MQQVKKNTPPAAATPTTAQTKAGAEDPLRSRNSSGKKQNSKGAIDNKNDQLGTQSSFNNENDAFNKHYNKELRVSKDEIPIVMAELNDSAYQFIKRE